MSATGDARPNSNCGNGADDGADNDVFFVSMQYRGTGYAVPVQGWDPVASIFDFVQDVYNRLVARRGRIWPQMMLASDSKLVRLCGNI